MIDSPEPADGPPQPYAYPWSPPTNGYAIAALVCGIVNMLVGSILALVFGYIAKREIDASNGMQGGRGLAIAGIVLGWVGVGIWILMGMILLFVFGIAALATTA